MKFSIIKKLTGKIIGTINRLRQHSFMWLIIDLLALYIVLSTGIQKAPYYYAKFSLWMKNREIVAERNQLLAQSQKKLGKRILVVTFNLTDTGAPLLFLSLTQELHRRGYNVSLLSYSGGRHEEDLKKEKIPYLISTDFYGSNRKEMEKLFRPFDLIISGRIPSIYLPSQERKFIWWDHGLVDCLPLTDKQKHLPQKHPFLDDLTFLTEKAQDVVFVSGLQQKKLEKCRSMSSEVIPNGIKPTGSALDDPVIKQIQQAKNEGKIVFVTVGYVDRIKGQDILVRAVQLLPDKYRKKATFFIVGKQKNDDYNKLVLDESKNFPEIVFTGPVLHEKIGGVYENADVLLVPSRTDTAPLVVQEAAEHYLPAIITDNVGSTFIVQNKKSGFVIPTEDANALAEKIKFFIDNPNKIKKFGKVSRQNYEKTSSYDIFIGKWEDKINRKFKEIKKRK